MTYDPEETYLGFKCLSVRPLVTISSFDFNDMGLLELSTHVPQLFDTPQGIHILSLTWNCEQDELVEQVAQRIDIARKTLPGHRFFVLANSGLEAVQLAAHGVECIQANASIFVDEVIWHATRRPNLKIAYDACYIARFSALKRHELAVGIPNIGLAYGRLDVENETQMRKMLPQAVFLNRPAPDDPYHYYSKDELRNVLHLSAVALCLSAQEGYSRTSIEALLCGVPVVSTPSIGGRDRYYNEAYVLEVEPTPEAVAHGVAELKSRQLNPMSIRQHVGTLIDFDRRSFISTLNKLCRAEFDDDAPVFTFDAFAHSIHDFHPIGYYFHETREFLRTHAL